MVNGSGSYEEGSPKRQASTEDKYIKRAEYLIARYRKTNNLGVEPKARDVVDWIIRLKPTLSASTWRQYKAAFLFYLKKYEYHDEVTLLESESNEGCLNRKSTRSLSRTSSAKKKGIAKEEYEKIRSYLEGQPRTQYWPAKTLLFLVSTLAVGLRPCEWPNARIVDTATEETPCERGPWLRVMNAKNSNNRSHGLYRHISLSEFPPTLVTLINEQIKNSVYPELDKGKSSSFEQYHENVSKCLYNCTKRIWPHRKSRPTLYSARHQFIANLKADGYKLDEIAALVGHATDETATEYYGKARVGRGDFFRVRPLQAEVVRIRHVLKKRKSPMPRGGM